MASSSRGWSARLTGRGEPAGHLGAAGFGDPVDGVALVVGAGGLDEPVPLQPGQGRVDLPDVQRPGGAGAALELARSW